MLGILVIYPKTDLTYFLLGRAFLSTGNIISRHFVLPRSTYSPLQRTTISETPFRKKKILKPHTKKLTNRNLPQKANKTRKRNAVSILELATMRIVISFPISFENRNADTKKALNINSTSNFLHYVCYEYPASDPSLFRIAAGAGALFLSNGGKIEEGDCGEPYDSLQYDFNRDSCPQAEGRIRAMVWYLRKSRSGVAPAFLRLVFRDCSIEVHFYSVNFSQILFCVCVGVFFFFNILSFVKS